MGVAAKHDPQGHRIWVLGARDREHESDRGVVGRNDWIEAKPARIRAALTHALALPSGNWFVIDDSRRITDRPSYYCIDGTELVAWRTGSELHVAPNGCPHMGAPLCDGRVRDGKLICPWHGLALDARGHGVWRCFDAHDDGVLAWVRLGAADPAVPKPILAPRPDRPISAVIRRIARCEPQDVIANRLDPWHGAHFHPHSFAHLRLLANDERSMTVRVAYRVLGPVCLEVDARFHCPDPRTIVMTIIDGEGVGSVVETHATPVLPGWSAITEATLATSSRRGFRIARTAASLIRPWIERAAQRLWDEDAAYAERLHHLRETAAEHGRSEVLRQPMRVVR